MIGAFLALTFGFATFWDSSTGKSDPPSGALVLAEVD